LASSPEKRYSRPAGADNIYLKLSWLDNQGVDITKLTIDQMDIINAEIANEELAKALIGWGFIEGMIMNSSNSSYKQNEPVKTGSLVIEQGGNFSTSEIKAVEHMKNLGNDVILRMPQGTRAGGGTSDLLVNGVKYDVYTPITENVNRTISSMAGKNSQTTGIVLDLSKTSITAEQLANALERVKGIVEAGGKTCNINDIVIIK